MSNKTTPTPTTQANEPALLIPSSELTLTLPWAEVKPVYDQVLRQLAKRVKSAGFRPGKVPVVVAKDIIGEDRLAQETAEKLVPHAYEHLIKDSGKQPISQPEFQAKKLDLGSDWEFTVLIAEKPQISVKDHEKVIKTAKKDAEKELEVSAKTDTKDKDKTKTEKPAQPLSAEQRQEKILGAIFKALVLAYKPQVPELLLKQETRYELEELVKNLEQLKLTLNDFLARRQMTFDQLSNDVATQTLGKLQIDLLFGAIIEDQKIKIEEADLDTFMANIKDEKQRAEQRQNPAYIQYITNVIIRQKVTDYLLKV